MQKKIDEKKVEFLLHILFRKGFFFWCRRKELKVFVYSVRILCGREIYTSCVLTDCNTTMNKTNKYVQEVCESWNWFHQCIFYRNWSENKAVCDVAQWGLLNMNLIVNMEWDAKKCEIKQFSVNCSKLRNHFSFSASPFLSSYNKNNS